MQTGLLVLFAWAYPRLRPGLRGTLAIFVGLFVDRDGRRRSGVLHPGRADLPATTTPDSGDPGGLPSHRHRPRDALEVEEGRQRGPPVPAAGSAHGRASCSSRYMVVFPISEVYVVTHAARAYVPTAAARRRVRGRRLHDERRASARGLVRALEERRRPSSSSPVARGRRSRPGCSPQHGYGVLLFDRRGEGESEGDPNGLGWRGTRDVHAAISFLQGRPDVDDRPDRRARPLGRRRGASAGGGRDGRPAGGRLRRARASAPSARRSSCPGLDSWITTGVIGLTTAATAAFTSDLPPPEPQGSQRRDRGAGVLHLRHARAGRAEPDSRPTTRRRTSPRSSGLPKAGTPARSMPSHRSTSGESSASSMTRWPAGTDRQSAWSSRICSWQVRRSAAFG